MSDANRILTCREMFTLLSEELDAELAFSIKEKIEFHLKICSNCRNYKEQLRYLLSLCHLQNEQIQAPSKQLTPAQKDAILRKLKEVYGDDVTR
ncbi:MAG: zf-HC2 domain-containing protein [Chitinivibrionales bacterium]|nr:zf-HC2 domain-containing protein [Chitinivibrionales bacterium]